MNLNYLKLFLSFLLIHIACVSSSFFCDFFLLFSCVFQFFYFSAQNGEPEHLIVFNNLKSSKLMEEKWRFCSSFLYFLLSSFVLTVNWFNITSWSCWFVVMRTNEVLFSFCCFLRWNGWVCCWVFSANLCFWI